MQKTLTNKTIEALKPQAKRYAVHDRHCPGFAVRVSTGGRRTFVASYRFGIKQRRITIGVYPIISLADAREKARAVFREVSEGIDPTAVRRRKNMTLREGVDSFIRQYAKHRNRSYLETERILNRELVSRFGERDVAKMTRADILEAVDAAVERGAHYQANRIVAQTRRLFGWMLERGIIETTPMLGVRAPMREISRDRVLSPNEIERVVNTCRTLPYPFGP